MKINHLGTEINWPPQIADFRKFSQYSGGLCTHLSHNRETFCFWDLLKAEKDKKDKKRKVK